MMRFPEEHSSEYRRSADVPRPRRRFIIVYDPFHYSDTDGRPRKTMLARKTSIQIHGEQA